MSKVLSDIIVSNITDVMYDKNDVSAVGKKMSGAFARRVGKCLSRILRRSSKLQVNALGPCWVQDLIEEMALWNKQVLRHGVRHFQRRRPLPKPSLPSGRDRRRLRTRASLPDVHAHFSGRARTRRSSSRTNRRRRRGQAYYGQVADSSMLPRNKELAIAGHHRLRQPRTHSWRPTLAR